MCRALGENNGFERKIAGREFMKIKFWLKRTKQIIIMVKITQNQSIKGAIAVQK
jgi:hypothetical protein